MGQLRGVCGVIGALGLMALVACGDKDEVATDDSGDGPAVNPDAPTITSLAVVCTEHSSGDTYFLWGIAGQANDPQGADTLEIFADLEAYRGGGLIETFEDLVVVGKDGQIVGSIREDTSGLSCADPSEFTFKLYVSDTDGNVTVGEAQGG
jgi:hypothetical protein